VSTLSSPAAVAAEARAAAQSAARQGASEVTVVTVDGRGRPTLLPAAPNDALSVASNVPAGLRVVAVEAPSVVHALSDPLFPQEWAFQSFKFAALWPCGQGKGITVAVVDSGVQGDHPDLTGRVLPGVAFLNGPAQVGAGNTDTDGHGTHVAGIVGAGANGVGVVGVAPQATILPVKVLDSTGTGRTTDVAAGITWAVDNHAQVINLSLGSGVDSASIETAVAYAISHNVVVVAAAGNQGAGGPTEYPAAIPSVIAVAGLDPDGTIASYSTRGKYVDVAAPGSSVISTFPPSTWQTLSGTSMASPFVAGLAALIIDARGTIKPAAMLNRLTSTATDAGPAGFDNAYGWGRINPVAALNVS
jgi:type VII secretion-associated serine protease mycosin